MECSCNSHGGFLTEKGLKEAAQRRLELDSLDGMDTRLYVDRVGSVSGLALAMELDFSLSDEDLENQYRRFLNGS